MAAVVTQDIKSTYVPNKSAELSFTIRGAASEADASTALNSSGLVPSAFNSIPRRETNIETEHFDTHNTATSIFRAQVRYYFIVSELDSVIGFDTTGGTQHITQSYSTVKYPSSAPDLQHAINYDGQRVNGVDITIPALTFTEQYYKSSSEVTHAYRKTLAGLTGKVNNGTFRTYAAGEVLFKGSAGSQVMVDGTRKWQITYTFAVSPNLSNFYVGSILVAEKIGWDYLWVMYADFIDGSTLIKRPVNVYVERICDYANFNDLGI
jgi:hypothetical protein